jgi:3-hydroxyacyl-[acyl-carrier-protein] dehydratase
MSGQGLTPHGPGFSFVDRVEVDTDRHKARAEKWLDPALPFFADHFPGRPLMPGVLLIEAAAQAAGCLWGSRRGQAEPVPFALARVDKFKLSAPVKPGERVVVEVQWVRDFGTLAEFEARLSVGGTPVASGVVVLASGSSDTA